MQWFIFPKPEQFFVNRKAVYWRRYICWFDDTLRTAFFTRFLQVVFVTSWLVRQIFPLLYTHPLINQFTHISLGTIKYRIRLKRLNEQAFLFLHSLTLPYTAPPTVTKKSVYCRQLSVCSQTTKNRDLNQKWVLLVLYKTVFSDCGEIT